MDKSTPKTRYIKDFPRIKRPDPIHAGNGFFIIGPWKTATERYCINIYKNGEHWCDVFADNEKEAKERLFIIIGPLAEEFE